MSAPTRTRAPRWMSEPVSDKQISTIKGQLEKKQVPADRLAQIMALLDDGMTKGQASPVIDYLFSLPRRVEVMVVLDGDPAPEPVAEEGIYETPAGEVYKVVRSGAGRLYAKVLVVNGVRRISEAGEYVTGDFEYEAGAIHRITPADRCSLERAKELGRMTKTCIVCGTKLEERKSVERGIGPVCVKRV